MTNEEIDGLATELHALAWSVSPDRIDALCALAKEANAGREEAGRLRTALQDLRGKMIELDPELIGVFSFCQAHGFQWPADRNWKKETDAADAALARAFSLPPAPGEQG